MSLTFRRASGKLPAICWNDCFYVVNEGMKAEADVRCQVLQRGIASNMLLHYQTTLSKAAPCSVARDDVAHTERV